MKQHHFKIIMKLKENTSKKRAHYGWRTSWSNSLKEISCFLPVSESERGRALTKKETLVHMLRYFDFLQTHIQRLQRRLPATCLPDTDDKETPQSEPGTFPHTLKAKRKYSCGRSRKKLMLHTDRSDDRKQSLHKEHRVPSTTPAFAQDAEALSGSLVSDYSLGAPVVTAASFRAEVYHGTNKEFWGAQKKSLISGIVPWSYTSNPYPALYWPGTLSTVQAYLCPGSCFCARSGPGEMHTGAPPSHRTTVRWLRSGKKESIVDQESPWQGLGSQCSVCDDRTGSEEGSQDLVGQTSVPFLLKDRMLGVLPSLETKSLPDSPTLPQTPTLPFLPLLGIRDGLNLSPSLFTSPARGLSQDLLPEGQEELQTLFEDVWVTSKPSVPAVPSLTRSSVHGYSLQQRHGGRVFASSQSDDDDEEERGTDDVNWTPKQSLLIKKTSRAQLKGTSTTNQASSVSTPKKKCVNGFIMFCRMNRKLYLRTHPGTPSSVVTKKLADLWHIMPKQERRVYCLKARHFSRQHNRNVRSKGQEEEEEEEGEAENCIPSPLHALLAHRDLWFGSTGKL